MIRGGVGGSNTGTGLIFEKKNGLKEAFRIATNFQLNKNELVDSTGNVVAIAGDKSRDFYSKILNCKEIDMKRSGVLSKGLRPDGFVAPIDSDVVFIIELKTQRTKGSVDEKLQTCVFKKDRYDAMLALVGKRSKMVYILKGSWFSKPEYKDTLDFMDRQGTIVCFDELPLEVVGLSG
jgi:hypothetical protein